jgi:lysyl-tRNA synthetase class 2
LNAPDWGPGADLPLLRARADLLFRLRRFFSERGVLEVETPLLCRAPVTDPNIEPLRLGRRFLQTSPEYAMKRLLAAGSGPIYQVCKAFRGGEAGRRHNPEFSLLEWYRPGFDLESLMEEVQELVEAILPERAWRRISYRDLFRQNLSVDPWLSTDEELEACARGALDLDFPSATRDQWLDVILSHMLEPQLAGAGAVFVYDFPASQAALARLKQVDNHPVSDRFELYVDGVELANAYCELTDAGEQAVRFRQDNKILEQRGQPSRPVDERLLAAMEHGLPDCAGVALGLDRLLMLARGCDSIEQVLAFSWQRA